MAKHWDPYGYDYTDFSGGYADDPMLEDALDDEEEYTPITSKPLSAYRDKSPYREEAPVAIEPTPAKEPAIKQNPGWGGDIVDLVTAGGYGLAGSLTDLAASGVGLFSERAAEAMAPASEYLKRGQEYQYKQLSPEMQASRQAISEAQGVGGTLSALAANPRGTLGYVVESLPSFLPGVGAARIASAGKGAAAAMRAAETSAMRNALASGMTKEAAIAQGRLAAQRAIQKRQTMAISGVGAAMGGGYASMEARDRVMKMPLDELRNVDGWQEALDRSNGDELSARRKLALQAGRYAAPIGLAAGGVTGALGARVERGVWGGAGSPTSVGGIAANTAVEGLTEAAQEGAEQFASNVGVRGIGKQDQELFEEVPKAMTMGGVLGSAAGAGAGAVGRVVKPQGEKARGDIIRNITLETEKKERKAAVDKRRKEHADRVKEYKATIDGKAAQFKDGIKEFIDAPLEGNKKQKAEQKKLKKKLEGLAPIYKTAKSEGKSDKFMGMNKGGVRIAKDKDGNPMLDIQVGDVLSDAQGREFIVDKIDEGKLQKDPLGNEFKPVLGATLSQDGAKSFPQNAEELISSFGRVSRPPKKKELPAPGVEGELIKAEKPKQQPAAEKPVIEGEVVKPATPLLRIAQDRTDKDAETKSPVIPKEAMDIIVGSKNSDELITNLSKLAGVSDALRKTETAGQDKSSKRVTSIDEYGQIAVKARNVFRRLQDLQSKPPTENNKKTIAKLESQLGSYNETLANPAVFGQLPNKPVSTNPTAQQNIYTPSQRLKVKGQSVLADVYRQVTGFENRAQAAIKNAKGDKKTTDDINEARKKVRAITEMLGTVRSETGEMDSQDAAMLMSQIDQTIESSPLGQRPQAEAEQDESTVKLNQLKGELEAVKAKLEEAYDQDNYDGIETLEQQEDDLTTAIRRIERENAVAAKAAQPAKLDQEGSKVIKLGEDGTPIDNQDAEMFWRDVSAKWKELTEEDDSPLIKDSSFTGLDKEVDVKLQEIIKKYSPDGNIATLDNATKKKINKEINKEWGIRKEADVESYKSISPVKKGGKHKSEVVDMVQKIAKADDPRTITGDDGLVSVVQAEKDLPPGMGRTATDPENLRINGVYDPAGRGGKGKVYLVADHVTDESIVNRLLLHEIGVHHSFRKLVGAEETDRLKASFMKKVKTDPAFRMALDMVPEGTPANLIAEEGIAYLVQLAPESTLAKRVIARMRAVARKFGLVEQYSQNDLAHLASTLMSKSFKDTKLVIRSDVADEDAPLRSVSLQTKEARERAADARKKIGEKHKPLVSPVKMIKDALAPGDSPAKQYVESWRQGIFDRFHGIRRMETLAGLNDVFNDYYEQSGYISARMSNGVSSIMGALLHNGTVVRGKDGVVRQREGGAPALKEILRPLQESGGQDMINDFFHWKVGERAARLKREDRERLFTDDDIKNLRGLMTSENEALFKKVNKDLAKFSKEVIDFAESSGIIDPESRKAWENDDYVPFFRLDEEKRLTGFRASKNLAGQNPPRRLKGGTNNIGDPYLNTIMNFAGLVDASMKNEAVLKTVDNLQLTPEGQAMAIKVKKKSAKKSDNIITVRRGGKKEYWKINDQLGFRALNGFNKQQQNIILDKARMIKRFITNTITLSPAFMAKNYVRDTVNTYLLQDADKFGAKNGFVPIVDNVKNVFDKKRLDYNEALLSGGAAFKGGVNNAGDQVEMYKYLFGSLKSMGKSDGSIKSYLSSINGAAQHKWRQYRDFGESVENDNRLGYYIALKEAGVSDAEALYKARDLMDFGLRGDSAVFNWFADIVPFFNARMQGMYKLGRGLTDMGRNRQNAINALAIRGGIVMAASLGLALQNLSEHEEEYLALEDWDRNANWHFWIGGNHLRVPKPFEIGYVFGTIPEITAIEAYENLTDKENPHSLGKNISTQFMTTFGLGPMELMPGAVKPLVEMALNKNSFTGRPIEGMGDEAKPKEMRFNSSTSETAKLLGSGSGLSPKQIDHLLNGYFNAVADVGIPLMDLAIRSMTGAPKPPETKMRDWFSSFIPADVPSHNRYTTQFFNNWAVVDEKYRGYRDLVKRGERMAAMEWKRENRDYLRQRKQLNETKKRLADLRNREEKIKRSGMTPERKRAILEQIRIRKNALTKRSVSILSRSIIPDDVVPWFGN